MDKVIEARFKSLSFSRQLETLEWLIAYVKAVDERRKELRERLAK